jgi:hypothetical protein
MGRTGIEPVTLGLKVAPGVSAGFGWWTESLVSRAIGRCEFG